MFKLDFKKGRGTRDQLPTCVQSQKKQENSRKTSTSALLIISKHLTVQITTVENSLRDGNTRPPYLTPEKSVCRSRSNSQNWAWNNRLVPNWERSTPRLYIVTLLIYLYAEYIMRNTGLDEAQARIKISGRNINNLRYADDTTLMAENNE